MKSEALAEAIADVIEGVYDDQEEVEFLISISSKTDCKCEKCKDSNRALMIFGRSDDGKKGILNLSLLTSRHAAKERSQEIDDLKKELETQIETAESELKPENATTH